MGDMMESIIARVPPELELLADPTNALDFQMYMFPLLIQRLERIWKSHHLIIANEIDPKEKQRFKDNALKRILITCLFSGLTMETSTLVLAEITA